MQGIAANMLSGCDIQTECQQLLEQIIIGLVQTATYAVADHCTGFRRLAAGERRREHSNQRRVFGTNANPFIYSYLVYTVGIRQ